ncbi:hypothetical protein GIB67_027271 [Kingdonia uniflora]|uniref:Uncharacterized protein n=1 Tax=Kingdonia uniflora TaxID=39325 RepID=A0A7J7KYI6_9MAGN|nr:hypothetical protein GIB67_027271 [Kingdonia uniflora]
MSSPCVGLLSCGLGFAIIVGVLLIYGVVTVAGVGFAGGGIAWVVAMAAVLRLGCSVIRVACLQDAVAGASGHMELIYQICANTRMYSTKDELLEKDVELSSTRVPHGEGQYWNPHPGRTTLQRLVEPESPGRNNSNNYSGRPYYQGSNSNQNQGGVSFTPNHQSFQQNTPYVPPHNRKPSSDDGIQALLQSNNQLMQQFMQMNQQSMSRIETSIVQLASGLSTRDKDNKVRMPEDKSRESPNPSTEKVVEGGKPICEETPFVEEETGQVSLSHMELIYQICANTRMYSSKDEVLEKDVKLSNTRVLYGEVAILEDNSWRVHESIIGVSWCKSCKHLEHFILLFSVVVDVTMTPEVPLRPISLRVVIANLFFVQVENKELIELTRKPSFPGMRLLGMCSLLSSRRQRDSMAQVDSINLLFGRSEEDGASPLVVVKQFIAPPVIEEFHVPLSHLLSFSDHDSNLISILIRGDVIHPNMCEQFRQNISDHGNAVAQLTMEERPRKMIMYINITSLKMANNQADQIIQRIMMGGNEEERVLESMEANRVRTVPASQSAIDVLEIKKVDEGDSTQVCVVCLEQFHGRCIVD